VLRPDFLSRRPLIPDFLLNDKREGRYITAVPAIGWDQQAGLNLGVVGFLFDNGKKEDPAALVSHSARALFRNGDFVSKCK
jgi:hypothetical protein